MKQICFILSVLYIHAAFPAASSSTAEPARERAIETLQQKCFKVILQDTACAVLASLDHDSHIAKTIFALHLNNAVQKRIPMRILKGHTKNIFSFDIRPDGAMLASASYDNTIRIWDTKTGKMKRIFQGYSTVQEHEYIPCRHQVKFSPDGSMIASTEDNALTLWNVEKETTLHRLIGHTGAPEAIAFSPDSNVLASSSTKDNTVRLWDTQTGQLRDTFALQPNRFALIFLTFHHDNRTLAIVNHSRSTYFWDLTTGQKRMLPEEDRNQENNFEFYPIGNIFAEQRRGCICIGDVATGQPIHSIKSPLDPLYTMCFSPNGAFLAACFFDHAVRIWDTATGTLMHTLSGHKGFVDSIAISPDNAKLASVSQDAYNDKEKASVLVWNTVTGELLQTLENIPEQISKISYSSDGTLVASSKENILLWCDYTTDFLKIIDPLEKAFLCTAAIDWFADRAHAVTADNQIYKTLISRFPFLDTTLLFTTI